MSFLRLACLLSATALLRIGLAQSVQLNGTIAVDSVTSNIITISVTNGGTHNYSILAKNNMFDNGHPYQPFTIQTTSGTPVPMAGTRFDYVTLNDAQFMTFPPAAVWTRQFNVSEFLLPDPKLAVAASQCYTIILPSTVPAILTDNMTSQQKLADLFFNGGVVDVPLGSVPLHHNVSDPAGAAPAGGTGSVAHSMGNAQAAATTPVATVPAQPSGVVSTQSTSTVSPLKLSGSIGQGSQGQTRGA